jgi:hypothetical protein
VGGGVRLAAVAGLESACLVVAGSGVLLVDRARLLAVLVGLDLRGTPVPPDQGVDQALRPQRRTSFDLMSSVWREAIYSINQMINMWNIQKGRRHVQLKGPIMEGVRC